MPERKETKQARAAARRAAGLCWMCGSAPPDLLKALCVGCGEKKRRWRRTYKRAYPERIRAELRRKDAKLGDKNRALKDAVYAAYGGYRCVCCGETQKQFLTLDHINNDGNVHRRTDKTFRSYRYYGIWRKGCTAALQVMCYNCNMGKARNGGVCPHTAATG